ncbi:hypothetical protein DFH09DRAFT_1330714 [Mycena vulgaris]|nr:hypothetical protein DFH09DRAFT_1330714 [Mycena vulgaris]
MTARRPPLGARDDVSTTEPLTITVSLSMASPTETAAAVSSAYAAYAQVCGPDFARVLQDGLTAYNGLATVPTTNTSDPSFLEWANNQDPDYMQAQTACQQSGLALYNAENNARPQTTATTTGVATTLPESGGSSAPAHPVSTGTKSDPGAPAPTQSTGAAMRHVPDIILLMAGVWVVQHVVG